MESYPAGGQSPNPDGLPATQEDLNRYGAVDDVARIRAATIDAATGNLLPDEHLEPADRIEPYALEEDYQ